MKTCYILKVTGDQGQLLYHKSYRAKYSALHAAEWAKRKFYGTRPRLELTTCVSVWTTVV